MAQKTLQDGERVVARIADDGGVHAGTRRYTQVHDVKYDDGLWQAQAHSTTGQRVEVYADPEDGRVVSAERD